MAHVLRRARNLLAGATHGAVRFPRQLIGLFTVAIHWRNGYVPASWDDTHLPAGRRQVCWAHLRRDFQAMIDRANAGSKVGEDLLLHADILLGQWKRVRDGTLTRAGFRSRYAPWVRAEVRSLLDRGAASGCARTAGTCREILAVETSLWTFAAAPGVEPTNNAAERALRHAVCWRKTSYGTDSEAGSRFAERVLTVVATCRQQGRDVLGFLMDTIQAARTGTASPSLVPAGA